MGLYLGGAGEPAMGLEAMGHCGGVPQGACGCILEAPYSSSREGILGRWGGRALPLPLPTGWIGELGGILLPLATNMPWSPGDLPVKFLGVIPDLPPFS